MQTEVSGRNLPNICSKIIILASIFNLSSLTSWGLSNWHLSIEYMNWLTFGGNFNWLTDIGHTDPLFIYWYIWLDLPVRCVLFFLSLYGSNIVSIFLPSVTAARRNKSTVSSSDQTRRKRWCFIKIYSRCDVETKRSKYKGARCYCTTGDRDSLVGYTTPWWDFDLVTLEKCRVYQDRKKYVMWKWK